MNHRKKLAVALFILVSITRGNSLIKESVSKSNKKWVKDRTPKHYKLLVDHIWPRNLASEDGAFAPIFNIMDFEVKKADSTYESSSLQFRDLKRDVNLTDAPLQSRTPVFETEYGTVNQYEKMQNGTSNEEALSNSDISMTVIPDITNNISPIEESEKTSETYAVEDHSTKNSRLKIIIYNDTSKPRLNLKIHVDPDTKVNVRVERKPLSSSSTPLRDYAKPIRKNALEIDSFQNKVVETKRNMVDIESGNNSSDLGLSFKSKAGKLQEFFKEIEPHLDKLNKESSGIIIWHINESTADRKFYKKGEYSGGNGIFYIEEKEKPSSKTHYSKLELCLHFVKKNWQLLLLAIAALIIIIFCIIVCFCGRRPKRDYRKLSLWDIDIESGRIIPEDTKKDSFRKITGIKKDSFIPRAVGVDTELEINGKKRKTQSHTEVDRRVSKADKRGSKFKERKESDFHVDKKQEQKQDCFYRLRKLLFRKSKVKESIVKQVQSYSSADDLAKDKKELFDLVHDRKELILEEKPSAEDLSSLISEAQLSLHQRVLPHKSHDSLRSRIVTTGDCRKIDDMLIGEAWERSRYKPRKTKRQKKLSIHKSTEKVSHDSKLGLQQKSSSIHSLQNQVGKSIETAECKAKVPKPLPTYEFKTKTYNLRN